MFLNSALMSPIQVSRLIGASGYSLYESQLAILNDQLALMKAAANAAVGCHSVWSMEQH